MSKLADRLETWIWVLLYGGLLLGTWSLFVPNAGAAVVWTMRGVALAGVACGLAMIYWRSTLK